MVTYGLKVLEDIMHKFSNKGDFLKDFIKQNINDFVLLTCLACDQDNILVKNQAQMMFKLLMSEILNG